MMSENKNENENKKKSSLLSVLWESMTKTGGCCGPGETCGGPAKTTGETGAKEAKGTEEDTKA